MYKMTKKEKDEAKKHAIEFLTKTLKPGDTVYTVLKHVSQSGMTRLISAYIVVDGRIVDISWHISHVLDWHRAENGGVKVGGCGMDMGFHMVYSLSYVLFKNDNNKSDAGYTLNQTWM